MMRRRVSIMAICLLSLALSLIGYAYSSPKVRDAGDYTRDKTRLHAYWNEVPKAVEYQFAIGTSPGGRDVIDWTSVGTHTKVDIIELNLRDGETYYFSVRAKKRKLIFSYWIYLGSSDGIIVDSTLPSEPVVTDEGAYTTNSSSSPPQQIREGAGLPQR